MRITAIRLRRVAHELDPPFAAAWDPVPRRRFEATIVLVETDEGLTGIGSGDTMDGFEAYEHLFVGRDPLDVEHHARVLETIAFHAGRYWPLEAALWDLLGKARGETVASAPRGSGRSAPALRVDGCDPLAGGASRARSAPSGGGLPRAQDPGRARTPRRGSCLRGCGPGRRRGHDGDHGRPEPGLAHAGRRPRPAPLRDRPPLRGRARRTRRALARGAPRRRGRGRPGAVATRVRHPRRGRRDGAHAGAPRRLPRSGRARRLPAGRSPRGRASRAHATSGDVCSHAGSRSRPTPGRTGSGCSRTCTSPPGSVAAPISSSRTTHQAGRRSGATSCWPSRSSPTRTGAWPSRRHPDSGSSLHYA